MPNVTQFTKSYIFGVESADAPSGLAMAQVNGAELRFEPEVYAKAGDGEGHTISIARTPCKITGTFTGYVTSSTYSAPLSFTFDPGDGNVTFIVKKSSRPFKKGEYLEVSVEAEGYVGLAT